MPDAVLRGHLWAGFPRTARSGLRRERALGGGVKSAGPERSESESSRRRCRKHVVLYTCFRKVRQIGCDWAWRIFPLLGSKARLSVWGSDVYGCFYPSHHSSLVGVSSNSGSSLRAKCRCKIRNASGPCLLWQFAVMFVSSRRSSGCRGELTSEHLCPAQASVNDCLSGP